MYLRAHKVIDGIVYDSDNAEILHYRDTWFGGRKILAVTPEGHYFEAMFAGLIMGWQIFPLSRLRAVHWALKNEADSNVLERLGVTLFPEPQVLIDRGFESPSTCEILGHRRRFFSNDLLYAVEFLCQNPDGRFFVYDGMILVRTFVLQDFIAMTQRQALAWAIQHLAPWESLEMLGYDRNLAAKTS